MGAFLCVSSVCVVCVLVMADDDDVGSEDGGHGSSDGDGVCDCGSGDKKW